MFYKKNQSVYRMQMTFYFKFHSRISFSIKIFLTHLISESVLNFYLLKVVLMSQYDYYKDNIYIKRSFCMMLNSNYVSSLQLVREGD